ncbi:hypothetical protein [Candidatus Albibeggiatoa sp. nov. NOAA]|uniref:hypothetical protein n=1 Tax=Candidatus Albibeggiatoa sp. nov. NOAA TaxID=3162724 RepID=UPI0032FD58F0|nr:hypothetical protein [Thiotrichaceae bacterium]
MRFHDYQLEGYSVLDRGKTINLHLVYDYEDRDIDNSYISFSDVVLYHFIHTYEAIIIDIEEIPLSEYLHSIAEELTEWRKWHGLKYWESDLTTYITKLESMNLRAWEITSAIGFYGFIIAKEIASD